MIFGNKNSYAIEVNIENKGENHIFGYICVWINDIKIGDYEKIVVLDTPIMFFIDSIKDCNNRNPNEFKGKKTKDVYYFLNKGLFGEILDSENEEENKINLKKAKDFSKKYDKQLILTNFSESFDNYKVFLIEEDGGERFIFQIETGELFEYYSKKPIYKLITSQFINWFKSL